MSSIIKHHSQGTFNFILYVHLVIILLYFYLKILKVLYCIDHFSKVKDLNTFSTTACSPSQPQLYSQSAHFIFFFIISDACDLSLDPTTAHEDLTISVGGKEARLSLHKSKLPAIRSPERFTQRRQVLCREGLQAERCYYEIEVKGGKAEIALAYKGINRKSFTKMSAFGANENSWSLDCSTNYSVSHKGDSVQLKTSPSHHRVGVYLKVKEGTLSFYEVSDSMKFLHKVEAEFTEPLYPGFWLGEKCCIRICDLRRDGL